MLKRLADEYIPADRAAFYDQLVRTGYERGYGYQTREADGVRLWSVVRMVQEAIFAYPIKTVLEVGCAEGIMTVQYSSLVDEVAAFDLSPEAIAHCPSRLDHTRFVVADVEDPSCAPLLRPWDLIILSDVLQHTSDIAHALARCCAVAKYVLLSCPVNETPNPSAFNASLLFSEHKTGDATGHIWSMDDDGLLALVGDRPILARGGGGASLILLLAGDIPPEEAEDDQHVDALITNMSVAYMIDPDTVDGEPEPESKSPRRGRVSE